MPVAQEDHTHLATYKNTLPVPSSAVRTESESTSIAPLQHPEDGGVPSSAQPAGSRLNSWGFRVRLMAALLFPIIIETLDYTVAASAQPHIASAFNRLDLQSWIGTSYVLTSTAFLPLFANITNIFGRHTCVQMGLLIFMVGSAISTGAQNMPMMLAGRGIAGVGAAALLTVTRVIFADNRSLNSNAWQTMMMSLLFSVGYSVGPVIGGALSTVSFRWIFAINLPIAVASSILVLLLLRRDLLGPQSDPRDELRDTPAPSGLIGKLKRVDWVGGCLFVAAAILILLGLSWGSTSKWSDAKVIACLVVGAILLIVFILWQLYLGQFEIILNHDGTPRIRSHGGLVKVPPKLLERTNRMIPLYIFTNYDVTVTSFACVTGGMLMFGCLYFLAIYWTIVAGFESTKSGTQLLYLSPGLGGGLYVSLLLTRFTRQPKWAIMLGQIIQPISVGLLGMAIANNAHGQINGFLAMAGAGIGMTIGNLEMQARFALANEHSAVSVTMNLFFRTAGGTIGLAQLAAVLESKLRSYIIGLIASGKVSAADGVAIVSSLGSIGHGSSGGGGGIESLSPELQQVVRSAYAYGTKWAFFSLLPWCSLAAIPVFFLGNIPDTDAEAREAKKAAAAAKLEEERKETTEMEMEMENVRRNPSDDGGVKPEGDEPAPANTRARKEVPQGPRFALIGPMSWLIYGVELLIGTRRRRSSP